MTSAFTQLFLLLTVALAAVAAQRDLRTGLIPNRLLSWFALVVVCMRVLGIALGWLPASTLIQETLYGALIAACIPLVLYLGGGLGGGDLKLLVVCGAALGPLSATYLELYAFVLAAAFVVLRLTYRGVLLRTLWRSLRTVGRRGARTIAGGSDGEPET
ncbi:MAG TPA: prepilin peptidase, partial [Polyangiales bacterium]|nr:prepilin peptidase [Polyangiales bacterium]